MKMEDPEKDSYEKEYLKMIILARKNLKTDSSEKGQI